MKPKFTKVEVTGKIRSGNNTAPFNNLIYGYKTSDIKKSKNDVITKTRVGYFSKKNIYGGDYFSFDNYLSEGSVWFDLTQTYNELKKRNKELGFTLGKTVFVKPLNENRKITKLIDGCLYNINSDISHPFDEKGINSLHTLFYKVEGSNDFYQITHLEKVDSDVKKLGIEETIGDNFINLIDSEDIYLVTESKYKRNKEYYQTKIETVEKASIEILSNIFSELEQTNIRLKSNEGLSTKIENIEYKDGKLYLVFINEEV